MFTFAYSLPPTFTHVWTALKLLRGPFIISYLAGAAAFVTAPPSFDPFSISRLIALFLFLLVAFNYEFLKIRHELQPANPARQRIACWVAAIASIFPILMTSLFCLFALLASQRLESAANTKFLIGTVAYGLAAIALFKVLSVAFQRVTTLAEPRVTTTALRLLGFISVLAITAYAVYFDLFETFGLSETLIVFCATVLGAMSYIDTVRRRFGIPVYTLLGVTALIYSFYGLNAANRKSTYPQSFSAQNEPTPPIDIYFRQWLEKRPRIDQWKAKNKKYPVFLVAAQGGGLYAAYHSALFLSRLQDWCPQFSDHLFAISGVSGGSLGSAAFLAALREPHEREISGMPVRHPIVPEIECGGAIDLKNQTFVRNFLRRDFLSPIIKVGLFIELPQLFFPFPFNDNRSKAFERTMSEAWSPSWFRVRPDFFGMPFSALTQGDYPALVLNSVEARSNLRVVFAPFRFSESARDKIKGVVNFYELVEPRTDVSISGAVAASAAFPYISAAETIQLSAAGISVLSKHASGTSTLESSDLNSPIQALLRTRTQTMTLVDGGYYDSSGSATITDIINHLWEAVQANNVELYVLSLYSPYQERVIPLSGAAGPIAALVDYQARNKVRFYDELKADARIKHITVELDTDALLLPLNWQLETAAFERMEYAMGFSYPPVRCRLQADPPPPFGTATPVLCAQTKVVDIVRGIEP